MLEASYELLRCSKPFSAMRLPPADDIAFKVLTTKEREGHFKGWCGGGEHPEIGVSTALVKCLDRLNQTMGHELIHLWQERRKTAPRYPGHNAEFKRMARRVCDLHGWDIKTF